MKVKVAQPFRLVHDGMAYGPGDAADVPDHVWAGMDKARLGDRSQTRAAQTVRLTRIAQIVLYQQVCVPAGNLACNRPSLTRAIGRFCEAHHGCDVSERYAFRA